MNKKRITMVDPMQIVKKGYKGCKSTRTVKNFASKYHVPCCYWKPRGGEKIMLIEASSFRDAWKAATTNTSKTTRGTRTKMNQKTRTNRTNKTRKTARTYAKAKSRTLSSARRSTRTTRRIKTRRAA